MDRQLANEGKREIRVGAAGAGGDGEHDACRLQGTAASLLRVDRVSNVVERQRRRAHRRAATLICSFLVVSLIGSASAYASTQRGHVFSFAFGSLGKGTGQFFHPSGLAVENATGDVYVADRENGRLEKFEPVLQEGTLVAEKPVESFHPEVPYAEAVAVDNCTTSEPTTPCSSTTDPSVGDVYVIGSTKGEVKTAETLRQEPKDLLLYKFTPAGVLVGKPLKIKSEGLEGVAVDSSGTVFVYAKFGRITELSDAETNVVESGIQAATKQPEAPGLAVDASGEHFYIGSVARKSEAGEHEPVSGLLEELQAEHVPLVAQLEASTGNVLVHELDYERSLAVAVNTANVAGNGVDELGDVYVNNIADVAGEEVTTVAQFSPEETAGPGGEGEGKLIQRFGAPGLKEGDGIAVDASTGAVYVSDGAANRVDVFELEPAGAPMVDSTSASSTEGGTTTLRAQVRAAGAKTTYAFEYGTSTCGAQSACVKTAAAELGEGFGDQLAKAELTNLAPGIYHYRVVATNSHGIVDGAEQTFTVLASLGTLPDGRAWELVSPPEKAGAEPEPIRHEGGLIEAAANGDAITYTADGPIPAGVEPEGNRNPETTQVFSSRDREAGHEAWTSQDITTPNETGAGPTTGEAQEYRIFSPSLALAIVAPYPSTKSRFAAPALSPLLPGEEAGKQETTIYLRDNGQTGVPQPEASEAADYEAARKNGEAMTPANPGYLPLVTKADSPPGPEFGRSLLHRGLRPQDATPDLSHVLYRSENPNGSEGLYEWGEGKSQLISVLPDKEPLHTTYADSYFGGTVVQFEEPNNVRHAISNNGARVFWSLFESIPKNATHLEVRQTAETLEPETLQLDTVQSGTGGGGPEKAVYQTASANGSKVFFTDEQRLTANSDAEEHRPDLYVAELSIVAGHVVSHLTDLTASEEENAEVLTLEGKSGGVIGASEDGSYIYFVANGALAPGAHRGHCAFEHGAERRPQGTTCNLYVRRYNSEKAEWEPTKLVAALSFEDSPDWDSFTGGSLGFMTSRVSPNGRYLAFMSDRSLTGYDNEDLSSKAPGERMDEEVYVYDAQQEKLVCASCNPTGARPQGVYDAGLTAGGNGEGLGLVVDRDEIWSAVSNGTVGGVDNWLAGSIPGWTNVGGEYATYQSRYLSNEGRLFFNSADPLVAVATPTRKETIGGVEQNVGVENVYEYEPSSVGACQAQGGCVGLISSGKSEHESAFLDASESGNDVFFLTAEKLVPQDQDENFDVYDAHVCEAGSPCPAPAAQPAPKCSESNTCQGAPPAAVESAAEGGSAIFSGAGNLVLPKSGVLPEKVVTPASKPLTRAQKLAKALKTCKKDKRKSKRLACEKQARGKYGPVKKKGKRG
jgi:DNA-binding beta-propeller fold protein YncE